MASIIRSEHIEAITNSGIIDCLSEDDLSVMNFRERKDPQGRIITLIMELLNQKHGQNFSLRNLNGKKIWTRSLGTAGTEVYITYDFMREKHGFSFVDDKEVLELLYIES